MLFCTTKRVFRKTLEERGRAYCSPNPSAAAMATVWFFDMVKPYRSFGRDKHDAVRQCVRAYYRDKRKIYLDRKA